MSSALRKVVWALLATAAWLEACSEPTCGDFLNCETGSHDAAGQGGVGGSAGKGGTAGQGGAFDASAGAGGTTGGGAGTGGAPMGDGGGAAESGGTGPTNDAADSRVTGGAAGASGGTMTDASAGQGGTGGNAGTAGSAGNGGTSGAAGTTGGSAGTVGGSGGTGTTGGAAGSAGGGSNDSGIADTGSSGSGGTGGGTVDGSNGDAGAADTRDGGFKCFDYPYGPIFHISYSSSPLPTFVGGTIQDGKYYLTVYILYGQSDGGTGDASAPWVTGTLAFAAGDIFYAIGDFENVKHIGTYSTSGFTLSTQTLVCASDGGTTGGISLNYDYTVSGSDIITHAAGSQAVLTWTKQ